MEVLQIVVTVLVMYFWLWTSFDMGRSIINEVMHPVTNKYIANLLNNPRMNNLVTMSHQEHLSMNQSIKRQVAAYHHAISVRVDDDS